MVQIGPETIVLSDYLTIWLSGYLAIWLSGYLTIKPGSVERGVVCPPLTPWRPWPGYTHPPGRTGVTHTHLNCTATGQHWVGIETVMQWNKRHCTKHQSIARDDKAPYVVQHDIKISVLGHLEQDSARMFLAFFLLFHPTGINYVLSMTPLNRQGSCLLSLVSF